MSRATWTLKMDLPSAAGSLVRHISEQLRQAILDGELRPGDQLPASRQLAHDLKVARGTVTTAIEILVAEGLVESRIGAGSFVSKDAALCPTQSGRISAVIDPMPTPQLVPDIDSNDSAEIDFRPCTPSMEGFPVADWRRCVARAASAVPSSRYGDPRGDVRLRRVIADYLRRARGLIASEQQVLISNGAVHAMNLLSQLYLDHRSNVVFEEPGYPLARQTFQVAGATILPSPVDADGLRVDLLPKSSKAVRFVYVTPSHQFPTGGRLSLGRRQALIHWAEKHGAIIIEDDYDGDFRYDVPPLAPMAAMPNSCVVYCGTFSKTLFPGLRIGYAVAPSPLIEAIANYRAVSEYAPNAFAQAALASFIAEGHYERHVHRMRRMYAAKRCELATALDLYGQSATLSGVDSGLHGYVQLPGVDNLGRIANNARQSGVLVPTVRRYTADQATPNDAIILGYSALSAEQIHSGVKRIFSGDWTK